MGPAGPARRALIAAAAAIWAGCGSLPVVRPPRDPLSAAEHLTLAGVYEAQGLDREAKAQYQAALKRNPSDVHALMALGNAAFTAGELGRAERYFKRALRFSPDNAGPANNLAMTWLKRDVKLAEAELLARDALATAGPLEPYVQDTLAQIRRRRAQLEARR
ncbi:MAG: tetratricopeptide repeat protein [Elusimicrobia bacterium]|nr:tetratricopeptide repeat protein [Elusimicrobiota bacterium]